MSSPSSSPVVVVIMKVLHAHSPSWFTKHFCEGETRAVVINAISQMSKWRLRELKGLMCMNTPPSGKSPGHPPKHLLTRQLPQSSSCFETLGPSISSSLAQAMRSATKPPSTDSVPGEGAAGLSVELAVWWGRHMETEHCNRGRWVPGKRAAKGGVASAQVTGIRAGFLEEVLSDSHLGEGIGDSQVKKGKEGIWGRGNSVQQRSGDRRGNSTTSGDFKKALGRGLNRVEAENKCFYLLIHLQVTNYVLKQ